MSKYRERLIFVNGKRCFIQDVGGDGWLWAFLVAITIIFWVYTQMMLTFHIPDDVDFQSEMYRDKAKQVTAEYIIRQGSLYWIKRGFVTESQNAKSFSIDEYTTKGKSSKEMTKYFNDGRYQVYISSIVVLESTSIDKTVTQKILDINKEYIVTIKASPHRQWYGAVNLDWTVEDIKLVKTSKKPEEINLALNNWKIPPSKTPSW